MITAEPYKTIFYLVMELSALALAMDLDTSLRSA